MSAYRLFQAALLCILSSMAAGCMVINENSVDILALDRSFPFEDGAEYTFCSNPVGGEPECLPVAIVKTERGDADWAQLVPLETDQPDPPERNVFILFFEDQALGSLAFIRAEGDDDALILSRAETTGQGVILRVPLCAAEQDNALGAAAKAAGAEVQGQGCIFPDQASLFEVAAMIAPGRDFPLFDEITIEK